MIRPSDFLIFADTLPEALILLSSNGDILAINKCAKRLLKERFCNIEEYSSLKDLLKNKNDDINKMLRIWSRSRTPIPAAISWKSDKKINKNNWRCQGFLITPSSKTEPAQVVLRCILGRGQLSEFSILNTGLEKTQNTLKKLLQTREEQEREHELSSVTLQSIGDAVITTDEEGNIKTLNPIAENLTGWTSSDAIGKPSNKIFNIINELTREPLRDPIKRSLDENIIIELSNHTILIARDGTEFVVEDSVAPIRNKSGEVFGAVLVFHDVTGNRLAHKQLEYLAQHDTLTGLNNRYYFEQELYKAIGIAKRGELKFALLYIDLDQFKSVNDTAGHSVGDDLLTEVAQLFSLRLRGGDTLARLGGDEFGVLLYNIDVDEVELIAESYQSALADLKLEWQDKIFNVTPSIGVSIIDKKTSSAAESLRQADVACYVAKKTGRNKLHSYRKKDDNQVEQLAEATLNKKINDALTNNLFVLYFQPITIPKNTNTNYYEILLRMIDENGEIIPPNLFLPTAERYSLMPKIDAWVIEHAIKVLEENIEPDYIFSINLSGDSFEDKNIKILLKKLLNNNRKIAESIVFEVTETSAVRHIERTGDFMRELLGYGVKFALDDFGTGFSSFAYLKHLPIDIIKIDGIFVKDIADNPADQVLVRTINNLAHSLGKKTVAEYVENEKIQSILEEIGVDYLQGYHIGKPSETM
jgi:diguanylate cyclase (GGDEF)-like protein/PAS domain S-box-containing protein